MPATTTDARGSLAVVGTGIRLISQITPEALGRIEEAEVLWYLVADPALATWLERQNASATSLAGAYQEFDRRREVYERIAERILEPVREGKRVCAAFYGHPGIFVDSGHLAIRMAREEGFQAEMLPGVSSLDCLVADLGVDPGAGFMTYEATDFLARRRRPDPTISLVLWQIGIIGLDSVVTAPVHAGLALLAEVLLVDYPRDHQVAIYEASRYPVFKSKVSWCRLDQLPEAAVTLASTLYVPRAEQAPQDAAVMEELERALAEASSPMRASTIGAE